MNLDRLSHQLKKYWHIFQIHWQSSLVYRGELFLWTFIDSMPVFSMLVLWFSVYRFGNNVGDFQLQDLVTYFIIGNIISNTVTVHFELDIVSQINDGTIAKHFLKPFSLRQRLYIGELSWKTMSLFLSTLPLMLLMIAFFRHWLITPSPSQLFVLIIFIVLGTILDSMLSFIIMAGSFFLDQGRAISHFKWMLSGIFGGGLLPLVLYPTWLEKIARILPFQFKFAVPMEIYLGKLSTLTTINLIVYELAWIIILYSLVRISWHFALRKFTAVGS